MTLYELLPTALRSRNNKSRAAAEYLTDTALLAHAASTPLTSLLFKLQQLQDESLMLSTELRQVVEQAQDSAEYLKQVLLAGVLDSESEFTVSDALNTTTRVINSRYSGNHCKIVQHITPCQKIRGSAVLFQEMIICIVNNAMEACEMTTNDTTAVTINCWQKKQQLVIQVIDNGCGISKWSFTPLFTRGYTSKENHRGLGLAFVKNVIINHFAGTLRINSHPDSGTVFTVSLPLYQ